MLKGMKKAAGGQPYQKKASTGSGAAPVETLKEIGITKKLSSEAQMLAELPEKTWRFLSVHAIR